MPDKNQVYSPREDTFLLLRAANNEILPADTVLEVGIGSAYIIRNLSPCKLALGTDINPHAALLAHTQGVNIIRTDFADGLKKYFSLVIFNPPYLPTSPEERGDDWLEFALDGGPDGREPVNAFCTRILNVLNDSGRVVMLISSLQDFSSCEEIFSKTGFNYTVVDTEKMEDGEELRVYKLTRKNQMIF